MIMHWGKLDERLSPEAETLTQRNQKEMLKLSDRCRTSDKHHDSRSFSEAHPQYRRPSSSPRNRCL